MPEVETKQALVRRSQIKRETDLQVISNWIEFNDRVLDIGCGRGILLEHLSTTKSVNGLGVDTDVEKVTACIKRGVTAYHGDAVDLLREFDDCSFDWVVLSRTVQELDRPALVIDESLRVAKRLAIGFANYGYWRNRLSILFTGALPVNEVFPHPWYDDRPQNLVSVNGFERFCRERGYHIEHRVFLKGDWRTSISAMPDCRAGYAVYAVARKSG